MSVTQLRTRVDPEAASVSQSDDTVRRTVLELNALCKITTLQFTLAIGGQILKGLYADDIRRLRSRARKDHAALRRVAADPDLAMSASALYRSVAIFDVCERIGIQSWEHVSTTHIRLVLALAPDEQEELLRQTEANGWTVRVLERRVAAIQEQSPAGAGRGGRKRRTRLRTMVDRMRTGAEELTGLLALGEDWMADSSPESCLLYTSRCV